IYGSVAKASNTASSDIDLLLVSDTLTCADVFAELEQVTSKLGRPINPTVYAPAELRKRIAAGNAFIQRVLAQPKLWLTGSASDLPAE
ncbi:MAG: nucleotidyltransferase domain-containing protein, partial [Lysobacterales bacterium]